MEKDSQFFLRNWLYGKIFVRKKKYVKIMVIKRIVLNNIFILKNRIEKYYLIMENLFYIF